MGFSLLEVQKLQISNYKYQTISNDRNSKSQTKKQPLTLRKLLRCTLNRFGICILEFETCPLVPCNGRRVYL